MRILLIDSDPERVRWVRRQLLAAPGTRLLAVPRLGEGLRVLDDGQIDVILASLSLTELPGTALVTRLCVAAPRVPLIVLSGAPDPDLMHEALVLGAQDCLPRTDDHRTLREAIAQAIARKSAEATEPTVLPLSERTEMIEVRVGSWGHRYRCSVAPSGPDRDVLLRSLITSALSQAGEDQVLVEVTSDWLRCAENLAWLGQLRPLRQLAIGAPELDTISAMTVQQSLTGLQDAGMLLFATDVGSRPLAHLARLSVDGLLLSDELSVLAEGRRGAAIVRGLVSMADELGWTVAGQGEALRFLGCHLISRPEWVALQ